MNKNLVVACVVLLLCATGAKAEDVLRLGVDPTYPPLEYRDPQGKMIGFDIELGDEICRRIAVKCEFVQSSFDGLIPGLLARKFDGVLSSLSITEQRLKQIDFSDKLSNPSTRLVARTGSGILPTPTGLQGKTVGYQQGTIQESYARTYWKVSGIKLQAYASQDQVYADLLNGRIDASLQDEVQASYAFLKTDQGKGYEFAGPIIVDAKVLGSGTAIGIRKEDQDLKRSINKAIAGMLADGTYQKIASKYFDFDIYGG
ncbi:ABC transporter substrate-binding protein [Pseudomonas edaphica]|uniref:ABC transporter substrate-binding protein n=1 Tax=Pseudomonas edaphica TaxID=2006980 RepID=A0A7Y7RQN3_9PSED|nr:ABC transporter substrate-binding protein [Pseudomonas edaphica]NVZ55745.1 ABC transporter substrate-binding protein [Pseudomonas edaphica]